MPFDGDVRAARRGRKQFQDRGLLTRQRPEGHEERSIRGLDGGRLFGSVARADTEPERRKGVFQRHQVRYKAFGAIG